MRNYTKGAKLRAKKELPKLAETPRRKSRGRKRMAEIKAEPNADRTVLEARARQAGSKDLGAMRLPAYGEPAGQAIMAIHGGDDARKLWDAYTRLTASEAAYAKRYLGLRLHAKTAKIEMMRERVETRPDDKPDHRSDDDKDRDAVNGWMRWRGYVMHLSAADQTAIFDVAYGRVYPMDGGSITAHGKLFVAALERFAKVVEKKVEGGSVTR